MRMDISIRWENLSRQTEQLDLALIVKQYEEVMIKNQLLKVCFEDMCDERDKMKVLRDHLYIQKLMLQDQEKTSQKLMVFSSINLTHWYSPKRISSQSR